MQRLRVNVIGLGYVGLPTACLLAVHGCHVHGVDVDPRAVARVRERRPVTEPGLTDLLETAVASGHLNVSDTPTAADVYVLAVPTPLARDFTPDVSAVFAAVDAIAPHLRGGELVCVESTCPIGTSEAVAARLPAAQVAYCPERVLPGRMLIELIENDRVVGGVDEAATARAVAFYGAFVRGRVVGTNARTAETVKLAENTFRDVNVAFANELSMLAERVGVDALTVISLANRHPRVSIRQPGPGVGGHCIAVDPWFLAAAAPDLARLTRTAREVNMTKTAWVVERVRAHLHQGAVVACLGLTYKPDVDDVRESPAIAVHDALSAVSKVLAVDPYVPGSVPLDQALAQADVVVGLVAHQEFRAIGKEQLAGKVVLDFAGVFA